MIATPEKLLRVLHVEDDENDVQLFARAIARACPGCAIEEAASPEIALGLLASTKVLPHVIITDNSFRSDVAVDEFIRTVRQRYPRIPILALSGNNDPAMVNLAYEAGVSAYFVKPATFDQLLRTVTIVATFFELSETPS
jgi:CheY-like chemotaxis protein